MKKNIKEKVLFPCNTYNDNVELIILTLCWSKK